MPEIKPAVEVNDYEVHYVTPDMIDWWWVNMEKGYWIWSPEHKKFDWEVPPTDTPVGAVQFFEQEIDGQSVKMRARYMDPKSLPPEIKEWVIYDHLLVLGSITPDGKIDHWGTFQYEPASYGTRVRSTGHPQTKQSPHPKNIIKHMDDEMARWPQFLPELYKMWQVVKDPTINRQCCCKVIKEGSTIRYVN